MELILKTKPLEKFRIFTEQGAADLARSNKDNSSIDLSSNSNEWLSLFSFVDHFDRAWVSSPFDFIKAGPIHALPEWTRITKRTSRPSHALAVCLTNSPGSRLEVWDGPNIELSAGEAVIHPLDRKFRLVGSKFEATTWMQVVCYIAPETE